MAETAEAHLSSASRSVHGPDISRSPDPAALRPADGRFGCGPSRVRPEQLRHLSGKQVCGRGKHSDSI